MSISTRRRGVGRLPSLEAQRVSEASASSIPDPLKKCYSCMSSVGRWKGGSPMAQTSPSKWKGRIRLLLVFGVLVFPLVALFASARGSFSINVKERSLSFLNWTVGVVDSPTWGYELVVIDWRNAKFVDACGIFPIDETESVPE
jgi:hypothetical protein